MINLLAFLKKYFVFFCNKNSNIYLEFNPNLALLSAKTSKGVSVSGELEAVNRTTAHKPFRGLDGRGLYFRTIYLELLLSIELKEFPPYDSRAICPPYGRSHFILYFIKALNSPA